MYIQRDKTEQEITGTRMTVNMPDLCLIQGCEGKIELLSPAEKRRNLTSVVQEQKSTGV